MEWNDVYKNLEALYVLDNAITDPAKDYLRLVRKTQTDNDTRYVVDNGGGDILDVVFAQNAIVIKGFDHENRINSSFLEWKLIAPRAYLSSLKDVSIPQRA